MKNWLKKYFPSTKNLQNSKELKGLNFILKNPCYWSYSHHAVARGIAAGLAGCVIPGFQLFYAAILVILLRGNLPIALLCTLVTNPLTVVPITYFVYFIGSLIIGNGKNDFVVQQFQWDFSSFHAFWNNVSAWILQFGKAFFVGLPIVSLSLGLIGYLGAISIWKIYKLLKNKRRS
jgi:uncharacterized protein (DUF2062 family)